MQRDQFTNCYEDELRAEAYASLEFANTYHLAYRDLPAIFERHAAGRKALDFGCGAGRSSRFMRGCGFDVTGIDVSPQMVAKAKEIDPSGDYRLVAGDEFAAAHADEFDLVLSAFTFDNVATLERKVTLFRSLALVMKPGGVLVNVVSNPDIYLHEWASFSSKDFPENRSARDGDMVRIITRDHGDLRPVEDIVWSDEAYRDVFSRAGLEPVAVHRPLATGEEPYEWISETRIAPWVIYVLRRSLA